MAKHYIQKSEEKKNLAVESAEDQIVAEEKSVEIEDAHSKHVKNSLDQDLPMESEQTVKPRAVVKKIETTQIPPTAEEQALTKSEPELEMNDQVPVTDQLKNQVSETSQKLQAAIAPYLDKLPMWNRKTTRTNPRVSSAQAALQRAKLIRLAALGGLISVVMGFFVFIAIFAWFSKDMPKPGEIVRREGFSTQIRDREGKVLYDLFSTERREPVQIDEISEYMRQATIAIEDKDFYKHQGFDPLTPIRIVYNYVFKGGRVVGGSTLTQQLVKNVLLTSERSLPRKFKEFVLSVQIERQFTKDEILTMYLNEIPYGGTAAGVQAASEVYFNKDAKDLNLVESAILAGLPQRPSAYSPYSGRTTDDGVPLWKWRALGVLRRMREDGYISDELEKASIAELDSVVFQKQSISIKAPHFVFYVEDKLNEMYGEEVVQSGGLKVTTTLDLALQEEAETIVREEIEKVKNFNISNGSVMVTDPQTGEILTMVGSVDYFSDTIDGEFNVAVNGLRQPGSSIKPVTYLAGLRKGYTPASMLIDVQTIFQPNDKIKAYEPRNYDGQYQGPVSFRDSLGNSLNTTSVKMLANVGVENMLSLAYEMGFPTLEPTKENLSRLGLAVTLGGGEVHLIDTVTAYSVFANGGYRVEPVAILKVEDAQGNVLFERPAVKGKKVIEPGEAFLMNHILSDNNARLRAFGPSSLLNMGKGIAVKTGTTNDQKDNWAIGWSQSTMVGAWVGNNDNTSMTRVASGITGASPIWQRIMKVAMEKGRAAPEWEKPENVEEVEVDAISGYPKHDDFPVKKELVIKGTLPSGPDPIHTKLKLCRGENKLASEIRVASGDFEEKEFIALRENDPVSEDGKNRWQEAINAWVSNKEDKFKPPTEYCDGGGSQDVFAKLNRPENEKSYANTNIEFDIEAVSVEGIKEVEIWVNGSKRETLTSRPYKTTIDLPAGRYEVYAKVRDNKNREAESNKVKIGTGGRDWKEATPSPTPTPTPVIIIATPPPATGGAVISLP